MRGSVARQLRYAAYDLVSEWLYKNIPSEYQTGALTNKEIKDIEADSDKYYYDIKGCRRLSSSSSRLFYKKLKREYYKNG